MEMFGISTFTIAMTLNKWLPFKMVEKFLLVVANFTLGNTDRFGLRRPKTSPIELRNTTGKTPVLDVGALYYIKSGKIMGSHKGTTSSKKKNKAKLLRVACSMKKIQMVDPAVNQC